MDNKISNENLGQVSSNDNSNLNIENYPFEKQDMKWEQCNFHRRAYGCFSNHVTNLHHLPINFSPTI